MSDPIGDAARDVVERMMRRAEDDLLAAMLTNSVAPEPSEPLTAASILKTIKALGPPPPPRSGQIVESVHMVDRHEDWSKVRSPSRTRRRMRYNAGRIYTYTPKKEAFRMPDGSLVMHPAMARLVREATVERNRYKGDFA